MQQALALFDEIPIVETLRTKREDQWYDRKSSRIGARELADWLIGFANADGGRIVVGIHGGQIEGVDSDTVHLNEVMQAGIDFTQPSVRQIMTLVECTNRAGQADHLLVIDIEPSETIVHRNRKQECFLRVGDENRRLSLSEEQQLIFDKGEAIYDKVIVEDLTLNDLDMSAVNAYARQRGATDIMALMRARGLYIDTPYRKGVTHAGHLLFGTVPPIWSYIRYLRYDGTTAETGSRSNLIKDVRYEGPIPMMIEQVKALLSEELKVIRLIPSGRFQTVLTLPEFAWLEAVVNAVTHRSYSIHGDGIRVIQFTDRLEVSSPGRLPGLVRVQNIRNSRFARNPHIARVLAEATDYVREQNEGVKRMFEEMEQSGLREPVYKTYDSSVLVTLYKMVERVHSFSSENASARVVTMRQRLGERRISHLINMLRARKQASTHEVAVELGVSDLTARKYLKLLEEVALVTRNKMNMNDPTARWVISEAAFWTSAPLI